jgi:3-oxoadipate enol-lactonase
MLIYGGQMAVVEAAHVPVAAGQVYCETAGDGPPVILTHDGLAHRESWDAQFPAWSADYRVARWDRRGYGRSDQPEIEYSSADDLAWVAGHVADSPAVLVGSSFGALVSIRCALDHPQLVAGLVLVGPIVTGLDFTEHFLTRGGRGFPGPDATLTEHLAYWCETDPWFIAWHSVAARQRLRELLAANPHNLRPKAALERAAGEPLLGRLGEIPVPTLVVSGEDDIPDVHAHSGALAAGIQDAERVVLSGSGHLPHVEVPDAFNTTVLGFLAELA